MEIKAEWTGKYPSLCCGHWKLFIDGKDVSNIIPSELRESPMDTEGIYSNWYFGEEWEEIWESYRDGKPVMEWIEQNDYWLSIITDDIEVKQQLFYAIKEQDWRSGSCGGCI